MVPIDAFVNLLLSEINLFLDALALPIIPIALWISPAFGTEPRPSSIVSIDSMQLQIERLAT